ncbi:hypothetical protein C7E14_22870, partial [Stenotrophomonas maltophilia]
EPEPMFAAAADALPLEAMAPQELTPALYEAARRAGGRTAVAGCCTSLLQRVAPAPLVSLRSSPLVASSAEPEPMFAAAADALPLEAMAPQELTPALYEAAR